MSTPLCEITSDKAFPVTMRMREIDQAIVTLIAEQRDLLISTEISRRLGASDWKLEGLKGRLQQVFGGGPEDTWVLDDKLLIEIWPAQWATYEDYSTLSKSARITIRYRTFRTKPLGPIGTGDADLSANVNVQQP